MTQRILLFKSILFVVINKVYGDCDLESGPAGSPECVLLSDYNKYQWATCLTNQYIQTFSRGKHICSRHYATYCYYQCMIEVHDYEDGPVFDDCACGRDAPFFSSTLPVSRLSSPALPDWCYSPRGDNCHWYRRCLEKRYPCEQEGNSYAIEFAEKFCYLYQAHYLQFDTIGREWIDAVRKCLQVSLVPILRPFVHKTCKQIKDMAFGSHPGCYLNPDKGKPSVCDIGIKNWWRMFWTVKSSAILAPSATFKQMFDVASACGTDILSNLIDNGMEMMQLKVDNSTVIDSYAVDQVTKTIPEAISIQLQWPQKGIIYVSYTATQMYDRKRRSIDTVSDNSSFYINVLLASSSDYNLNDNRSIKVNISEAARDAAYAVQHGDVHFVIDKELVFKQLSLCTSYNCSQMSLRVIPTITSNDSIKDNNGWSGWTLIIVICASVFGIALLIALAIVLRKTNKC